MNPRYSERKLDTQLRVEIPGGIDIEAQLAGPAPRALAYGIDLTIRVLVLLAALIISLFSGALGLGFWLILWFAIEWFYPVLFETFWQGQTPGKRALGLSVTHDDLTPLTFGTSLVRNLLRAVDFLPSFYLLGLITMLCCSRFQRLGDLAAGTIVISSRDSKKLTASPQVEPLAPALTLSRHEQIAVIEFMQRSEQLSRDRQDELAEICRDIVSEGAETRATTLQRMGAWYLGLR